MSDEDEVGSVAEEAAKLFGALGGSLGGSLGDSFSGFAEHLDTGAPECTWCPVCRTVHAVRTASPEVKAQLANAASSFLQAASALLAAAAQPGPASAQEPPSSVQHIDLDDDAPDEHEGEGTL